MTSSPSTLPQPSHEGDEGQSAGRKTSRPPGPKKAPSRVWCRAAGSRMVRRSWNGLWWCTAGAYCTAQSDVWAGGRAILRHTEQRNDKWDFKSSCVQGHYDNERCKIVSQKPELQDQDRFCWSQTGHVLRPTVSDHITDKCISRKAAFVTVSSTMQLRIVLV